MRLPILQRPDGKRLHRPHPMRRVMPYLLKHRVDGIVYHQMRIDLSKTLPWLERYNHGRELPVTLFQLLVFATAQALWARPGLNRFVMGGRIYQRDQVSVSFVARQAMLDGAPDVALKVEFPRDEDFALAAARMRRAVDAARSGATEGPKLEMTLIRYLPGFLIRFAVTLIRALDRWNLVPAAWMRDDPMYTSVFLANLGSVGIGDSYHHLYEYGTVSVFGTLSQVTPEPFVVGGDALEVRPAVRLGWTFDERINDGFESAKGLDVVREILEDPERRIGATPEYSELPMHH